MKKRFISMLMTILLLLSLAPMNAFAARKQMEPDVPVWTEETVKNYAEKFIHGSDLEILWGYYDLQIRRYMPMRTYETMLTEIEWMTGKFIGFGTYDSFEEPARKLKTHVLHLCMEKQDLDLYFVHKDREDDWEVMALEFVPAEKQEPVGGLDKDLFLERPPSYREESVTVGEAPYPLQGILTLPEGASAENPVRACVLVHDSGAEDMDGTIGQVKFFMDLANFFAERGIATLRYDKRTHVYGDAMSPEEIAEMTVRTEIIEDAISAGRLLQDHEAIHSEQIVLVGYGKGAMVAPRIVSEARDVFRAMLMIAGRPQSLLELAIDQNRVQIAKIKNEQPEVYKEQLQLIVEQPNRVLRMKPEAVKNLSLFGVNAYYYWEAEQYNMLNLITRMKVQTYIVQGSNDTKVPVEKGLEAYADKLDSGIKYVNYQLFRGVNHVLRQFTGPDELRGTPQEYEEPGALNSLAARDMVSWMNGLWKTEK